MKNLLPEKYYLHNFLFLLRFVAKHYGFLLSHSEKMFLQCFENIPEAQQCLFVRMANRTGGFFRKKRLKYSEIADIQATIEALIAQGFAQNLSEIHTQRMGEVLNIFTKNELLAFLHIFQTEMPRRSTAHKNEVIDFILKNVPATELLLFLGQAHPIVQVGYQEEIMLYKFLFFGNRHADMTTFVVRDLGIIRFEEFGEQAFTPQFQNRKEVEDCLMISLMKDDFYAMKGAEIDAVEVFRWFMDWTAQVQNLATIAQPAYNKLVLRVAQFLERQKQPEYALEIYRLTAMPPAQERQIRLLHKLGFTAQAIHCCEQLLLSPQNADEHFFATDFLAQNSQKKLRTHKSTTQYLAQAECITIDKEWKNKVELGVIHYFLNQQKSAIFSENMLWNTLFGLLFWDIIFDTSTQAIHHPLQRSPSDLFKPDFFVNRRQALLERLGIFSDTDQACQVLMQTFHNKLGIENPFVVWSVEVLEMVLLICQRVSSSILQKILIEMASNLREHTRGFPDLLVWDDNDYCLIEVKSPTDHLSSQQLHWLIFFEANNLNAKVLRVTWQ